jgi:O-antigen/teichoic acid export membrane protein
MISRNPSDDGSPTAPLTKGGLDEPLDGAPSSSIEPFARLEPHRPASDLKRKTAVSILWTGVRTGSDYFLSFVIFAILARTLGPSAFGVFALAVAFAEFGRVLPSTGLVTALARARHVPPEMADTVFWSTLALSVVIAGLIAIAAPFLAGALGEPAVAPLLTALGLILPISAAGTTHITLMLRDFGHRSMASRSVVSGVLGGGAALAAAWAGWGPWSLVVQRGVSEVTGTAMAWHAHRWLPGRRYSFPVLRSMASLSVSFTVTQLLFVALVRIQDLIIGRMIGAAAVGVYRTAWRTIDAIAQSAIMPFAQVSLPALTRLQDDLPAFRKAYVRIVSVSAAIAFPAIIGFAVLAPDAVTLIFGPRWVESGKIARVLGFIVVPFSLNYFAGPGLAVLGRSGTLARLAGLQAALTIVLTLAAAPFGLTAIAGAYVLRAYLTLPVQMWAFKRYSGLGYRSVITAIAPALAMALLMAGALIAVDQIAGDRFQNRGLYLLLMTALGAGVYAASMMVFARRFVLEQIRDLKGLFPGSGAKVSGANS